MAEKKSWAQLFSPTKGEFGQRPPAQPTIDEVERGRVGIERYGAAQPIGVPRTPTPNNNKNKHHNNKGRHGNHSGHHGGNKHHRGKGR